MERGKEASARDEMLVSQFPSCRRSGSYRHDKTGEVPAWTQVPRATGFSV
jgi:hypothetical protein